MVPGQFCGFPGFQDVFCGFSCSRSVDYGSRSFLLDSRWVFMDIQGSRLVFMVIHGPGRFSFFQVGFMAFHGSR